MRHRVRAAGILIEDDRLLLVREGTLSDGTEYWIPPGGGLEPEDASLVDCLRREFLEETGYDVEVGPLVYLREFREPSSGTHHVEASFRIVRSDRSRTASEPRQVRWFSRGDLSSVVVLPIEVKDDFLSGAGASPAGRYLGVTGEF